MPARTAARMLESVAANLFEVLQQRRGRVLFVSGKDSTRSRVAEMFAQALGEDVLEASSDESSFADFDLIVNLDAGTVAETGAPVLHFPLEGPGEDPASQPERERIETLVQFLVDHFRRAKEWNAGAASAVSAAAAGS